MIWVYYNSEMYLTLVIVIVCHPKALGLLTISLVVVTAVAAVPVRLMATKKNDQHTLIVDMKRHMPMYVSIITTVGTETTIIY